MYISRSAMLDRPDYLVDDYGGYRDAYNDRYDQDHGEDRWDDYAEDYPDEHEDRPARTAGKSRPPAARGGGGAQTAVRAFGEVLVTLGMVVLLFVIYELYVTNIFSAQKQSSATSSLDQLWGTGNSRSDHFDLTEGSGIAKMYIPAFGTDYHFTVIEGTSLADLAVGPGHYTGTALPGQPGNFSVAGHRVGQGDPFNDLGLLQSCDAVVVETNANWYVYRVLPFANEVANWSTSKGTRALCQGPNGSGKVVPLGAPYTQTVGQEIVLPSQGDEVAAVPHHQDMALAAGQGAKLMTMTTCNPQFSDAQRMIVHAVLVKQYAKNPNNPTAMPPEMREQT
jgi:sortase (surface protein transpeptidase)